MADLSNDVHRIECAIRALSSGEATHPTVRRNIRTSLQNLAEISTDSSSSLADTFEDIATENAHGNAGAIAAVVARLVSCSDLLPNTAFDKAGRHMVQIVERGLPSLFTDLSISAGSQTHERLAAIRQIHSKSCEKLQPLQQQFTGLPDLTARRQVIMKSLNFGPTKHYLNPFGFQSVLSSVSSLLGLADKVVNSHGRELQSNIQDLLATIRDEIEHHCNIPTFIAQEFFVPFLHRLEDSSHSLFSSMADKFDCNISVPRSPYELEKRYPLHVIGSKIDVVVPMTNEGPGVAERVRAFCLTEHCHVQTEETVLGDIEPGPFVLPIVVNVTEPHERIEIHLDIEWGVVGQTDRRRKDFSLQVSAQRMDLDWDSLSRRQPYSLEVAYDEEFYGRRDAIHRILRRLAPASMQSCYITGQKRVGKSSLARAVERELLKGVHGSEYHVLYLECGEIRHSTGKETLREFGTQLEAFLFELLPEIENSTAQDYSSSLNPLNRVLRKLELDKPSARVVVILDEFDEVNEDLYRHGELANTFFLNLRTFSSKRNLAFVLVGAERMPYVMASQGEKLNRFARESLDSFDLSTEWADYRSLVEQPVVHAIKIHEAAVRKLFDLTNGHPYFTKVICAAIFEAAVEGKDAEVSEAEVKKAAERVVATLDINAFAHYWRDGIRGDANDIEIVSLHRCRVLVAWARTSRVRHRTTHETILNNLHSRMLPADEVMPLLDDFCRRGVFRHVDDVYFPAVELFAVWLREGGFSRLISDQLGDELAAVKQSREDEAYVHANELVGLVNRWDLYQGKQITAEDIRAWLGQTSSNTDQRLLFKVLQNVRFVRDPEAREKFAQAHRRISLKLPVRVKKTRAQRRDDILVTYVDGPGKSGAHYASLYALENEIRSKNVVEPSRVADTLVALTQEGDVGVVVVDDLVGTGNNLHDRLKDLSDDFTRAGIGTKFPLSVVVLCGTRNGEIKVRSYLEDSMPNADLETCEILDKSHFAFSGSVGFWKSDEEKEIAKSLLRDLGVRVQKRSPLGYGNQGLLLTFPRNCPNNSLPILHGSGKGGHKWNPIFPRSFT